MKIQLQSLTQMRAFAEALAGHLRAGDLLILSGNLGAGKTTFTQSLGRALDVAGRITSPTFVIAREHPSRSDGPALVHVDAYRLSDAEELGDLDLDSELEESITVVEWGEGLAEQLSSDYLGLTITPNFSFDEDADTEDEHRIVELHGHGNTWDERWQGLSDTIRTIIASSGHRDDSEELGVAADAVEHEGDTT